LLSSWHSIRSKARSGFWSFITVALPLRRSARCRVHHLLQPFRLFAPRRSKWYEPRVGRGRENSLLAPLRPRQDDVRFSSSSTIGHSPSCHNPPQDSTQTPRGVWPQAFREAPRKSVGELIEPRRVLSSYRSQQRSRITGSSARQIHNRPKGGRRASRRLVFFPQPDDLGTS